MNECENSNILLDLHTLHKIRPLWTFKKKINIFFYHETNDFTIISDNSLLTNFQNHRKDKQPMKKYVKILLDSHFTKIINHKIFYQYLKNLFFVTYPLHMLK